MKASNYRMMKRSCRLNQAAGVFRSRRERPSYHLTQAGRTGEGAIDESRGEEVRGDASEGRRSKRKRTQPFDAGCSGGVASRGQQSGVGPRPSGQSPPSVDDIIARLRRAGSVRSTQADVGALGSAAGPRRPPLACRWRWCRSWPASSGSRPGGRRGLRRWRTRRGRNRAGRGVVDTAGREGCSSAHELAVYVDEPELVTSEQMDAWCRDFDNWATCDTACFRLFDKTPSHSSFRKSVCGRAAQGSDRGRRR